VAAEMSAAQREDVFWADAKAAGNKEAFEAYLINYPTGRYANLAKANIARLSTANVQVVSTPPVVAPVITPPVTKPVITNPARLPGGAFKDCDDCPEMVVIPAGSFEMGGTAYSESPRHRVTLNAFSMGKTEVTQGQWRSIMGTSPSKFSACGDTCPVETVSWVDAQAFVKKLSAKTGKQYRLSSEAEWEYACRAGGQDEYCGSGRADDLGWHGANSGGSTRPVGGKQANAWGLHDMSGNVWEWTEDCWKENYNGAPTDGSAWTTDNCSPRVVRGGSWYFTPQSLRAANRDRNSAANQVSGIGFRVARTN
jgi:formylglycine-generating enzyme required for sulfatase activity